MRQKKLIIHTEAASGWGGQEIRTFTECQWFRDEGFEVVLLARVGTPIWERFQKAGFEVVHVPFQKKTLLKDMMFCRRFFEERRPEVVATHSNVDSKSALLGAMLAKVPQRIRYRHVSLPVKASLLNKLIYKKWATQIITTGDCIAKPLIEDLRLDPKRVHTIPTGVDPPEVFIDREEARLTLCHELNLPEESRFIGQVSVLRRWKGQADVMEGFERIAEQFPNYHLVFVGGGHGEKYLPPIAADKKCAERIHFVGHQPNPWPYFRALDVNLLASTEGEGIPQVGMQSMLSGTPFIGTKVGGIPEIVSHEETGLLIDSESPVQLGEAVRRCLGEDGLSVKLSQRAQNWAKENCRISLMGERVLSVFELT